MDLLTTAKDRYSSNLRECVRQQPRSRTLSPHSGKHRHTSTSCRIDNCQEAFKDAIAHATSHKELRKVYAKRYLDLQAKESTASEIEKEENLTSWEVPTNTDQCASPNPTTVYGEHKALGT